MKTKKILFAAAALTLLSACADDVITMERVPVTLAYKTIDATETRAAQNLNEGIFANGETLKVRISNAGEGDWTNYDYTTGDAGAMIAPTPGPYYPAGSTNIDIVAFYPATAGTSFTVATDQTADADYKASDLMFALVEDQARQAAAVELAFTHKMAKLDVNITAGEGISSINSVSILNVKPTVSFNKATGKVVEASGDAVNIAVSNNGSALIPAQTVSGDLLSIVTDQGTATYKFNSEKTLEAGKRYLFDLTVNLRAIGTTNAITNWVNGNKLVPTVTVPTANTLIYTGEPQELITAGSTTGGEMQYKLDDGIYSTAIPTATNAGDYIVWYKVVGNNDYEGVDEAALQVTIAKATPTITAPKAKTLTYTGNPLDLITAGTSEHGTFTYSTAEDGTYTEDIPQGTDAGDYTVWYKFTGNTGYSDIEATQVTDVSIAKAPCGLRCDDLSPICFSGTESINTSKSKHVWYSCGTLYVISGDKSKCTTAYSSGGSIAIYRQTDEAFTDIPITVYVSPMNGNYTRSEIKFYVSAAAYGDPGVSLSSSQPGYIVTTDALCYSTANVPANKTKAGVVVYKNGSHGYVVSLFNIGCSSASTSARNGDEYGYDSRASGVAGYTPTITGYTWTLGSKNDYTTALTAQWSTANGYISNAGGRALDIMCTIGTVVTITPPADKYWTNGSDIFSKDGEWSTYVPGSSPFSSMTDSPGWVRPIFYF